MVVHVFNDRQQSENKRVDLFEGAGAENDYEENAMLASCKSISSSQYICVA